MKHVNLIILLFLVNCCQNDKTKVTERRIHEFVINKKNNFKNLKTCVLSRNSNDIRVIVSDYYSSSNGSIIIQFNDNGNVNKIGKIKQNSSLHLSLETINSIRIGICNLGLNAVSSDSCGNVYISESSLDNYQSVYVSDKDCLDKRYNYKNYKNNFLKIIP